MMWKEFEQIAGYRVSYLDYVNYIEPMYMALPESVNKQEFAKMIDRKRFALPDPVQILRKIKAEARHLQEICGHSTDNDSEHRLEDLMFQYAERKYGLSRTDHRMYANLIREYEFPSIGRGCTYPCTMVIGRGGCEYARINLV